MEPTIKDQIQQVHMSLLQNAMMLYRNKKDEENLLNQRDNLVEMLGQLELKDKIEQLESKDKDKGKGKVEKEAE